MKWIGENEGNVMLTLMLLALFVSIAVTGMNNRAEAVLGGAGTLADLNNPHNLAANSNGVAAVSETQICVFCHTPHGAIQNTALINGPLWNHKLSEATYTVKAQSLFANAQIGNYNLLSTVTTKPDGSSRMCLSCHDGTVALGETASHGTIEMAANACLTTDGKLKNGCSSYIGTDLTSKHVVSVPMNAKLLADSLANCVAGVNGQTTKLRYPFDTTVVNSQAGSVFLRPTSYTYGGEVGIRVGDTGGPTGAAGTYYKPGYAYGVQCSTCHDAHYWVSTANPQTAGYRFLVIGFDNLCNACHKACGS